jgi:hypothetical protein
MALRRSIPVRASLRLTGVPAAMLAASLSTCRSPLLQGSRPWSRAVTAACQSIAAIRMAPWPASSAVVMNWLVKSSRCSQLPQLLSRLTAASAVRMPLAQACKASVIRVTARPSRRAIRGGPARDVGERGHAELDGVCRAPEGGGDLGELVIGAREADLEPFHFTEPAFAFGLGDAVEQVGADLLEAVPLGGVRPQERAPDTCSWMQGDPKARAQVPTDTLRFSK